MPVEPLPGVGIKAMKKPNSQIHLRRNYGGLSVACSSFVPHCGTMADVKPDSLNAFQRQGSVSHEGAKVTKVLNPQSQNRGNSIRQLTDRIENHEKIHLHKRVCEDGFSHGSTLKSLFEFHPVFTVFKLVSISVNWWLKNVLNALSFVSSCLRVRPVFNAFKLEASSYKLFAFNSFAFRRSDRSAWTKADSPSQNRSAQSRFATVQPISRLASFSPLFSFLLLFKLKLSQPLNQLIIFRMASNPNPDKLFFISPISDRSIVNSNASTPIISSSQWLKMNRGMFGILFPKLVILSRQIVNFSRQALQALTKTLCQMRDYGHRKLLPMVISCSASSRSRSQTLRLTPLSRAWSKESVSSSFFHTSVRSASESFGISSKISLTLMNLIWSMPLKSSRASSWFQEFSICCSKGWGQIATPLSIETSGGKQSINCANVEGLFRIIQYIPSPFPAFLLSLLNPLRSFLSAVVSSTKEDSPQPSTLQNL